MSDRVVPLGVLLPGEQFLLEKTFMRQQSHRPLTAALFIALHSAGQLNTQFHLYIRSFHTLDISNP